MQWWYNQGWVHPSPLKLIKIIYFLYLFNLEHNYMGNHNNNEVIVSHLIAKKVTQRQLRITFSNGT